MNERPFVALLIRAKNLDMQTGRTKGTGLATAGDHRGGRGDRQEESPSREDIQPEVLCLVDEMSSLERRGGGGGDSNVTGSYLATLITATVSPLNFPPSLYLMSCHIQLRLFCGRGLNEALGVEEKI